MMLSTAGTASADELTDRINAGEPIRLGFATAVPWAYPGEGGEPLGFVKEHLINGFGCADVLA
jgi:polar amino acid transport system substrate-binding protein